MSHRSTLAKTTVCAAAGALAAALSACAAGHRTAPASPAAPTATRASAHASSTPATPTLNGPALRAMLPTNADLNPAITLSGAYDTGTGWTAPGDLPTPSLPGADCTAAPSIDADALTSDYRAAYATEQLANAGNVLQLVVAATNPGDAAKQLAGVRDFARRCKNFAAPNRAGAPLGGTTELDTFAALGQEALRIRVAATGPDAENYAQPEVILVRVGDTIAAVCDADPVHDQAAALSAARFLAARLSGQPR